MATIVASTAGQHSATQEKQNPQSGGEPKAADIGSGKGKAKTPFYTTASAAWEQGAPRASFSNSPALAKGLWGQSRPLSTSSALQAYQRPGNRSDTGSGQGGMNEGHSDPNTGISPILLSVSSSSVRMYTHLLVIL